MANKRTKKRRKRIGLGYGDDDAIMVTFRITKAQHDDLAKTGGPLGLTYNLEARRRCFPDAATHKVVQYVPAFHDGQEPATAEGTNVLDILHADWVLEFSERPGHIQWALADGRYLVSVQRDGQFWVVARVVAGDFSGLPTWEPAKPKEAE
jgi:hypothetical protein